jgi:hypothetical protein
MTRGLRCLMRMPKNPLPEDPGFKDGERKDLIDRVL